MPFTPAFGFWYGFYTTEYKEYARKMAIDKTAPDVDTGLRHYHVMEYELDDDLAEEHLRILRFREPDENWAKFVVDQRLRRYSGMAFDIVEGPSADVAIDDIVDASRSLEHTGLIDWADIAVRFESDSAKNQILLHTPRSVGKQ